MSEFRTAEFTVIKWNALSKNALSLCMAFGGYERHRGTNQRNAVADAIQRSVRLARVSRLILLNDSSVRFSPPIPPHRRYTSMWSVDAECVLCWQPLFFPYK